MRLIRFFRRLPLPPVALEWWRYLSGSPLSRARQFEELAALDHRMLRDIGLTRADVARIGREAKARQAPQQSPRRAVTGPGAAGLSGDRAAG